MAKSIACTATSLVLNVTRRAPELITPAGPTPNEFKELSSIDVQDSLRFHIPVIQFYRNDHPSRSAPRGRDPARVIKEAVAKALVPYYPLAGRLREKEGRKLVVECNGEGVMFTEAEAGVSLEEFGDVLLPPFPCLDELLYDATDSNNDILDTPLILIQITRLKCGGFIFALRVNHIMADGVGLLQFMNAVAELAQGARSPSIQPVWERHLLSARNPPQVTCEHREYDEVAQAKGDDISLVDEMIRKSFFFGPIEIAALRRLIPPHQKSSAFDIVAACVWRCRTMALQFDPDEVVRVMCTVNARSGFRASLPKGYYGNGFAFVAVVSTARELSCNPISYALDLIKSAKAKVTQEYMMSFADALVLKASPRFSVARSFMISDLSQISFYDLDFGWGSPTYGGLARPGLGAMPEATVLVSVFVAGKNERGEKGIVALNLLPENAMVRFTKELNGLLSDDCNPLPGNFPARPIINSAM